MASEEILRIVRSDIEQGLGPMFGPREVQGEAVIVNPDLDDEEESIGSERLTAVPWIYRCLHDGDFEGLFPTGVDLDIHGVTFVDNRKEELVLFRYVDWMGVATQLGLEVSWRVPVDEVQYRKVLDELDHDRNGEG